MTEPKQLDYPELAQDEDEAVRRAAAKRRRAQRAEIEAWYAETERIDHAASTL